MNRKTETGVLLAAILWARNHIEFGLTPDLRSIVVNRLDAVLKDQALSAKDMALFRERYPLEFTESDKRNGRHMMLKP